MSIAFFDKSSMEPQKSPNSEPSSPSECPTAGTPAESPPGGYFIMYGYEKTADHRSTLTEARACGQKLCDEDPLPSTWSIHDAEGDFVEDITRSDGKTLEQLIKDFRPNS
jgi:hypothetical protein